MLAFTENKTKQSHPKKRREEKLKAKQEANEQAGWASSTTQASGAAWHDPGVEKMQVRIEDASRLRKLKKEEAETQISGKQYAERLQEYYEKNVAGGEDREDGDLFSWAKQKPAQLKNQEEEDEDPIAKLLKSNARVFDKTSNKRLKPGNRLDYTKLANANAGFYHQ